MSMFEKDKEDGKGKKGDADGSVPPDPPRKVGRIGKPKVRTGCITCKVRRIKCDEGKPFCNRCTSTGRKCDGYASPKKPKEDDDQLAAHSSTPAFAVSQPSSSENRDRSVSVVSHNPLLDYHGTLQELRSFEYFLCHTAPTLAGWFDESFWRVQLPQVGHNQATVRHAMIAVASVHEQMEVISAAIVGHWKPDSLELATRRRFALQQYNAAIHSLRKLLLENPGSVEITLSCCILFICIEFLRGNFSTAIIHLHSGLQIMSKWRQDWPLATIVAPLSLEDNLIRIFERLSFQSILTDKPLAHLHPTIPTREEEDPSNSAAFSSLLVARYSLDYITKEGLYIIKAGEELALARYDSPRRVALEIERLELRTKLQEWGTKFMAFYSAAKSSMSLQERQGSEEMRILQLVTSIWVETSLRPDETAFDEHMKSFEEIIVTAEGLHTEHITHDKEVGGSRSRFFSFDMGILAPVYFVAIKCRHRILRRRAVALLKAAAPRREGMWNSGLLASAAEKAVEFEEVGMAPFDVEEMELDLSDISEMEFPPEEKRIHDTSGMTSQGEVDSGGGAENSSMRNDLLSPHDELGPHEHSVSFVTRPGGIHAQWDVHKFVIWW